MEEKVYVELREEIQRLRDEQQRLRDEQEKLRREKPAPSNGKSSQDGQNSADQKEQQGGGEQNKKENARSPQDAKKQDTNKNEQQAAPKDQKQEEQRKPPLKQRARTYVQTHRKGVLLSAAGFVAAVILAIVLVIYLRSYESTDDAQVDGHLNSISARISGTVTGVYTDNNQFVREGQLLVDLDPRDYQVALAQAKASYVQSEEQLRAENPNLPIIQTTNATTIATSSADVAAAQAAVTAAQQDYEARLASVRQAEANNAKAQTDVRRYGALVQREEISHEQFDTIVANAKTQAATVEASLAAAAAAEKAIDQSRAQLLQAQSKLGQASQNAPRSVAIRRAELATREAGLLAARAQEAAAQLNLSYTTIVAPVAGIVTERSVEVGQHIQAGEQLCVISQLEDIWITANFKETQLRKMRPGQPVDVKVDAFGYKYHGYVESMPGATGAVTSLLPPENATGNFVKVVQRMPVRIRLKAGEDPEHRLRPGMSVVPKVWLK